MMLNDTGEVEPGNMSAEDTDSSLAEQTAALSLSGNDHELATFALS